MYGLGASGKWRTRHAGACQPGRQAPRIRPAALILYQYARVGWLRCARSLFCVTVAYLFDMLRGTSPLLLHENNSVLAALLV